jgi:hypothetical protein
MPGLPPNRGTPQASRLRRKPPQSACRRARRVPEPAQGSAGAFPAKTRRARVHDVAGKPAELRHGKMCPRETPGGTPAAAQPAPQRHAAADQRQRALRSEAASARLAVGGRQADDAGLGHLGRRWERVPAPEGRSVCTVPPRVGALAVPPARVTWTPFGAQKCLNFTLPLGLFGAYSP